jgi:hypothetical protein
MTPRRRFRHRRRLAHWSMRLRLRPDRSTSGLSLHYRFWLRHRRLRTARQTGTRRRRSSSPDLAWSSSTRSRRRQRGTYHLRTGLLGARLERVRGLACDYETDVPAANRRVLPIGIGVRRWRRGGQHPELGQPHGRSTAWSIAGVLSNESIGGVSCPSISLCVAVGGERRAHFQSHETSATCVALPLLRSYSVSSSVMDCGLSYSGSSAAKRPASRTAITA